MTGWPGVLQSHGHSSVDGVWDKEASWEDACVQHGSPRPVHQRLLGKAVPGGGGYVIPKAILLERGSNWMWRPRTYDGLPLDLDLLIPT